jgi:hypothetical protein
MPSPGKKAFPLRLDPALHAAIERLAAQELRSVNAEIEFLLRDSLKKRGVKLDDVAKPAGPPADDAK